MAIFKLDYYKGEDLYSDGDVENRLLALARSGLKFLPGQDDCRGDAGEQDAGDGSDFPVLYHFARARENILNWYPFEAGASCLEIGSGCGAITGLLCSRMARVVSNELSRRRAEINYERHKEYDNLEIWVGNLNDMEFGGLFDYIVLNGVFEYAESFTPGSDPYGTFLRNIRRFLKPDGVILIAIENRLGLKYFAGAPEDHTDGYFDGIRGYEASSGARTFSQGEWEALMRRCGLPHYKFYYPYPDYKFPQEIFTDISLKEQKYGRPTWNFTKYRMALFEETKMAATLSGEGVMARFANSFLIEMSAEPLRRKREIQYVKLSTDRADEYSIATVIEERSAEQDIRVALKLPMTEAAKGHIRRMLAQMNREYEGWHPLHGSAEEDGIVYPYLAQKSLAQQAADAVREGDLAAVKALVKRVAGLYAGGAELPADSGKTEEDGEGVSGADKGRNMDGHSSEVSGRKGRISDMTAGERESFREVFGPGELSEDAACVCPANIDLILDNIFEADDGYQVIDCEWIFDFPVPAKFLLWRAVNELYSSQPALKQLCPRHAFMEEFGISAEADGVFRDWSTHFAEEYVGANRLLRLSRPEIGISIGEFRQRLREKEYMISQLFVDIGNGFTEEQKLVKETKMKDGAFCLTFDLGQFSGVRSVRFDPLEGKPCVCRIDAARTTARLQAENAAAATPEGDLFLTVDPIYRVKLPAGADRITISGEIRTLTAEDALARASELLAGRRRRFPGFGHIRG